MQKIGIKYKKEVRYVISNMDNPLGSCIGNSLEVMEAIDTLKGNTDGAFYDLCVELASNMVSMAKEISIDEAAVLVRNVLSNGLAYNKFIEIVHNQGGDINKMKISSKTEKIYSKKAGVIKGINALEIGKISLELGAGRREKEDVIDHSVGIILNKIVGESVKEGDLLMTLYVNDKNDFTLSDDVFEIN